MKRYLTMATETQDTPGYYVWDAPGQPAVIHLHLDVLDRLSTEVMRGFGAVPKRGAEVGGVLLGTIEPGRDGNPAIVRVEDFEPVECEYERGPSYLFTEDGRAAFEDAVQRWQADSSKDAHAVGYFRSHTRDGLSLALEDIQILEEFFPEPENVALLVKPYGTKVSEGGFFVRKDGAFPAASPLEFPFRRRELTGEEPPPHRSMMERRPRGRRREMTDGGEARAMAAPTSIAPTSNPAGNPRITRMPYARSRCSPNPCGRWPARLMRPPCRRDRAFHPACGCRCRSCFCCSGSRWD